MSGRVSWPSTKSSKSHPTADEQERSRASSQLITSAPAASWTHCNHARAQYAMCEGVLVPLGYIGPAPRTRRNKFPVSPVYESGQPASFRRYGGLETGVMNKDI